MSSMTARLWHGLSQCHFLGGNDRQRASALFQYLCFPDELREEFELSRSLSSLSLSRLDVLFLTVVLSICFGLLGLFGSIGGVSGSLSDSLAVISCCFDGYFVNRLCPRETAPLMLHSCVNSAIGFLIQFL